MSTVGKHPTPRKLSFLHTTLSRYLPLTLVLPSQALELFSFHLSPSCFWVSLRQLFLTSDSVLYIFSDVFPSAPGHLYLDVQPQKKSPSWTHLLETHLSFQTLLLFACAISSPSHCGLHACQEHPPPDSGMRLSNSNAYRGMKFERVKLRDLGWAAGEGGNGSWPSPQCWGAIGPGGDSGKLEGAAPGHPCCHVGMSAQGYQIYFQRECGIHLFISGCLTP